jgi:tetratricopeptide (TPR) repeat protein
MIPPSQTEFMLQRAAQHVRQGHVDLAERTLAPLLTAPDTLHPELLHLMGQVRYRQNRGTEAANFLIQSLTIDPNQPSAQFGLGKILAELGRLAEAIMAYRNALKLKQDFIPAQFELGILLHKNNQLEDAEDILRRLLAQAPNHMPARLVLSTILAGTQQLRDAETLLRGGLSQPATAHQAAELHTNLAIVLRLQQSNAQALEHFEKAQAIDPALTVLDTHRAELLQDLQRSDEALDLYRGLLARDPQNITIHNDYNDLLYRLRRQDEYLKSFDRAPRTAALQLAKAEFLMRENRTEDAYDVYAEMLAYDPADKQAAAGAATAFARMGRYDQAVAAFETLTARFTDDVGLHNLAATAFINYGDPQKALQLCQTGLAIDPANQDCLAAMGIALRLMDDERDEILNGYDTLIRTFDLDPPQGFSDMATFNTELCAYLEKIHPRTRDYVSKSNVFTERSRVSRLLLSLRGGSQTVGRIFGAGHDLVDRLQVRITEATNRYVTELKSDESHPFLSRRRNGFSYTSSWSSRLRDRGFHVNHIHATGWISSCYYAGVPDVAQDQTQKQGWIKFGEPDLDVALVKPVRRTIQPVAGRLVLFPSYMWHGTMPFYAPTTRMTIAFDVLPH